ncbi:MAG: hypothetical protein AAB967_00940, partial [Patescibacteria group bacterium]
NTVPIGDAVVIAELKGDRKYLRRDIRDGSSSRSRIRHLYFLDSPDYADAKRVAAQIRKGKYPRLLSIPAPVRAADPSDMDAGPNKDGVDVALGVATDPEREGNGL